MAKILGVQYGGREEEEEKRGQKKEERGRERKWLFWGRETDRKVHIIARKQKKEPGKG